MPERKSLDELQDKISATRRKHRQPEERRGNASMLGLAWRFTVEMLAGIGVGGFVGWWMDKWFGTEPIFMLVMLVLGMGAGLMNSVRTVNEMRRKQDAIEAARKSFDAERNEE